MNLIECREKCFPNLDIVFAYFAGRKRLWSPFEIGETHAINGNTQDLIRECGPLARPWP
jgi:hypothetical protein